MVDRINLASKLGINSEDIESRLELIADEWTSSVNASISWSDDDYVTFNTPRTVDISKTRKVLLRLGAFERRAFKLTNTANSPVRASSLEMNVRRGHYGQT